MHHDPAMPVKMTALKHKSLELRALVQYRDHAQDSLAHCRRTTSSYTFGDRVQQHGIGQGPKRRRYWRQHQVSEPTTAQMQQYNALISPIMQVLQAVQSTLYPDPPNNGLAWLAIKIHLLPFFSNTWEMRVR